MSILGNRPKVPVPNVEVPEHKEIRETLSEFQSKLDYAKMNGEEWVETTPEIIKYFNRSGLNGADYYIHSGIKVCETGKRDTILAKEEMQMDSKLHGGSQATWVQE